MDTITLGEFRISRVVESEGATPVGFLLPGITEDMLATHEKWLAPHFYDPASGDLVMSIHSFIVKTPRHTILIDTCVGNDKKRPVPNWNMRLSCGWSPQGPPARLPSPAADCRA